ncbi:hypothetical protein V8065_004626 [Vibrio parahaemolyticus]
MIKKTDLQRAVSGAVNQKTPIYHRVSGTQKRPIGSLKAEALKFEKSICATCNGALTQPHDYSWDIFSSYLAGNVVEVGKEIDLTKVYGEKIEEHMLNVHLFFCKIFGCAAQDAQLKLDLSNLANSIITQSCCPDLYIKIRRSDNGKSSSYCALSDIQVFTIKDGTMKYAHLFYTVGNYSVDIVYSTDTTELDLTDYFKPKGAISKVMMGSVEYNQEYSTQTTS